MQKFKLLYNILFLSFLLAFLPGCIRSDIIGSSNNETSTALFTIDEITGSFHISERDVLPEKFIIKLRACISSRLRNEPLPWTEYAITHHKDNFTDYKNSGRPFTDIKASSHLKTETGKEIIRVKSNGRSCINWTEEFTYAYHVKSEWILIGRAIQGLSTGWPGITEEIQIAVNPWLQLKEYKHLQVVDYRDQYGHKNDSVLKNRVHPNGLEFLKTAKQQEKTKKVDIIIEKMNFALEHMHSRHYEGQIRSHISGRVNYTIQDIFGNLHNTNPVLNGSFIIQPGMIAEIRHVLKDFKKGESKRKIIDKKIFLNNLNNMNINTHFQNDELTSRSFTWVSTTDALTRPISLYVKVIPTGAAAKKINPFEGTYQFGQLFKSMLEKEVVRLDAIMAERHHKKIVRRLQNLKKPPPILGGGGEAPFKKFDPSIFEKYNNMGTSDCVDKLPAHLSVNQYCFNMQADLYMDQIETIGWRSEPFEIRFLSVEKENWLYRRIKTIINTTITHKRTNRPLPNQKVRITVIDLTTGREEKYSKITEDNGKISFDFSTEQYWYKKQRYFLKLVYVESDTGDLNTHRIIAINPWDFTFTHGFEVNHPNNFRAVCSDKTDLPQIGRMLTLSKKQLQKTINHKQMELIHKVFCHNTDEHHHRPPAQTPGWKKETQKWVKTFAEFSQTFREAVRVEYPQRDEPIPLPPVLQKAFEDKFVGLNTKASARVYTHLFRAINKYPTVMVDDSLNRDLFYNVRIKITPRVVRMDSIALGQQDKGKLRDGVWLFQIALLKNDQERAGGAQTMAEPNFLKQHQNSQMGVLSAPASPKSPAYTSPLYTCPHKEAAPCLTKDDFIVPPVSIPVLARDGVMRSDIKIPILMENLLFANSKNMLVFTITPADPETVICQDGSTGMACIGNKEYEWDFDWQQTIKNVRPANPLHYDMGLYTYKIPFIPSEWNNWNITQETDISFSQLQNIYSRLPEPITAAGTLTNTPLQTAAAEGSAFNTQTDLIPQTARTDLLGKEHIVETNMFSQKTKAPAAGGQTNKPSKPDLTRDLTRPHISYFAEKNALCTIPIAGDSNLPKACGKFESAKQTENEFIKDLNKQIAALNTVKKEMKNLFPHQMADPPVLIKAQKNSLQFRNKLKRLPNLNALNANSLAQVIHTDWHNETPKNLNQISFMHALCGFWFEHFYTPKYAHTKLLADAFKNTVRQTFYYKLRGLHPLPASSSGAGDVSNTELNQAVKELEVQYAERLMNMQLKGEIDDLHQWINSGQSLSEPVHHSLYKQFDRLLNEGPFAAHTPSWEEGPGLKRTVKKWMGLNSQPKYAFQTAQYLNEVKHQPAMTKAGVHEFAGLAADLHPVRKCFSNPSHFFGFEKKIIAGQTGPAVHYLQGEQTTWTVGEEFLMNTQRDQGANQDFSTAIGTNLNLLALPLMFTAGGLLGMAAKGAAQTGLLSFLGSSHQARYGLLSSLGLTTLFAIPSAGYNYRSYTGTGKRRMLSYRVNEQVELKADHSTLKIHLNKYHECLVVRPRASAFEPYSSTYEHIWSVKNKTSRALYEKIGLLLCTPGKNPHFAITEDYYYIYPNYDLNSITIDPRNYRNKPFVINLRGRAEYNKLMKDLSCFLTKNKAHLKADTACRDTRIEYHYMLAKHIEFAHNLRAGFVLPKLFHTTGPAPGVYSPPRPGAQGRPLRANASWHSQFINWWAERQFMDADLEEFVRNTSLDEQ